MHSSSMCSCLLACLCECIGLTWFSLCFLPDCSRHQNCAWTGCASITRHNSLTTRMSSVRTDCLRGHDFEFHKQQQKGIYTASIASMCITLKCQTSGIATAPQLRTPASHNNAQTYVLYSFQHCLSHTHRAQSRVSTIHHTRCHALLFTP